MKVPSPRVPVVYVMQLADRERRRLLSEMSQVRGLMPLLMKRRNRLQWSNEDLAELRTHLRRLSALSPYLVAFAMPGGLVMLPALAWWLDRRRQRRSLLAAQRERS